MIHGLIHLAGRMLLAIEYALSTSYCDCWILVCGPTIEVESVTKVMADHNGHEYFASTQSSFY